MSRRYTKRVEQVPPQVSKPAGARGPAPLSEAAEALRTSGEPLDLRTRLEMEQCFGFDFSKVRIHTSPEAATSAERVNARAFTVGQHIAFGPGQYAPQRPEGWALLVHELAHAVQQGPVSSIPSLRLSQPGEAHEQMANAAVDSIGAGQAPPALGRTAPHVARDPKPTPAQAESGGPEAEEGAPRDTFAGTAVSEVIISLARKRVGFRTSLGMILGTVDTDLQPGKYELKPELAQQRWVIMKPVVKEGFRFKVTLEGATPWTLSYPENLPLLVTAGLPKEPKAYGEMFDSAGNMLDPLLFYEDMPPELTPRPIAGIDDFEDAHYDLDYHSEKGALSKWLRVHYRDGSTREIHLDTITASTPKLWAAKQEALKVMDEYNLMFMLAVFPTVFFIITIAPTVSVPGGTRYTATRRTLPKGGGGNTKQEPVPKQEPAPAQPKTPAPKEPAPPAPVAGAPKLSIRERLDVYYQRLKSAPKAKNSEEALKQVRDTLDQVEDQFSGVVKKGPPPSPGQSDGRMYPPLDDFVTRHPDGRITAKTRGHNIEIGADGSITITNRKTRTVELSKP